VDVQIAQGLPCQTNDPGSVLPIGQLCKSSSAQKSGSGPPPSTSGHIEDNRYTVFDTLSDAAIRSYNPGPNYTFQRLNGYDFSFTSRREIKWADDCPQTRNAVNDTKARINIISLAQLAMLIITLVVGAYDIYYAYHVYKDLTDNDPSNDDSSKRRQTKFDIACGFINCVPNLVAIVIAYMSKNFYASLNSANCSDALTNDTFNYLAETITKLSSINIAKLAATFLYLCYSFYKYWSKYGGK
jgi:hypothetical protein